MFNLTVSEAHTFYVGTQGWLVHNGGPTGCGPFSRVFEGIGADGKAKQFGITTNLTDDGILETWVLAKKGLTPSGSEMFNGALAHYGSAVKKIQGYWVPGGEMAENFISFNNALARGLSPEKAAMDTFTGKMAIRNGFGVVESVEVMPGGAIRVIFGK